MVCIRFAGSMDGPDEVAEPDGLADPMDGPDGPVVLVGLSGVGVVNWPKFLNKFIKSPGAPEASSPLNIFIMFISSDMFMKFRSMSMVCWLSGVQ